jgi:hypothetical protein
VRVRDQGGPPVLANVGHPHDLEHRLPSPWLRDKLGDIYQGFGGKFDCGAEVALSGDDAPDNIFKGWKCSQLLGVSAA